MIVTAANVAQTTGVIDVAFGNLKYDTYIRSGWACVWSAITAAWVIDTMRFDPSSWNDVASWYGELSLQMCGLSPPGARSQAMGDTVSASTTRHLQWSVVVITFPSIVTFQTDEVVTPSVDPRTAASGLNTASGLNAPRSRSHRGDRGQTRLLIRSP